MRDINYYSKYMSFFDRFVKSGRTEQELDMPNSSELDKNDAYDGFIDLIKNNELNQNQ